MSMDAIAIFKLNTDCCDYIFDYLNRDELYAVAQTCKTMQHVVGEYYQRNYIAYNHIYSPDTWLPMFSQFMSKITINDEYYQHFTEHCQFIGATVRYLELENLQKDSIDILRHFSKIHTFSVLCTNDNSYPKLLEYCPDLKKLTIMDDGFQHEFSCVHHNFPNIEDIRILHIFSDDFGKFLEKNANIRSFSTGMQTIVDGRKVLLKSKASLDTLKLDARSIWVHDDFFEIFCKTMDELYARGFYKRLYLGSLGRVFDQTLINRMAAFKGLEALHITADSLIFNWPTLSNVKELIIGNLFPALRTECIADAFENVERVFFQWATIDHILPFIRRSKQLHTIKALIGGNAAINLQHWNRQREQLADVKRVTIYVHDFVFLSTKWTTLNGDIDLNFIEMKRFYSCEWDHEIL